MGWPDCKGFLHWPSRPVRYRRRTTGTTLSPACCQPVATAW
nr:hypothetical protein [Kibdelosporangium sp. MJ126-NF4]